MARRTQLHRRIGPHRAFAERREGMSGITYFFALAFSRTEQGEARAEAAIRALNEEHAISIAAHFEGEGRGAVAFAKSGDASIPAWADAKILARFGDVPDDDLLSHRVSDVWASARSDLAGTLLPPATTPTAHSLPGRWLRSISLAARRDRLIVQGRKPSLAMTSFFVMGLALSGGAMLIISAKAAQRESRLVEMARPACGHTAMTNEELHRLVRNEYNTGTDKQNTLRSVVALCQANLRML
jgi:8-oxo-dGTP pyrophosphatase MutT (NUDIX family)